MTRAYLEMDRAVLALAADRHLRDRSRVWDLDWPLVIPYTRPSHQAQAAIRPHKRRTSLRSTEASADLEPQRRLLPI